MVSYTNNTFHSSQILLTDKVRRYTTWGSNIIFSTGIVLCLSNFAPSHISIKLINIAIAPVLFGVAYKLDKLRDYASGYASISDSHSLTGYRQWIDASLAPPKTQPLQPDTAPTVIPEVTAPIKYAPIDTALKKPHLMILGETGSGKSTICKYLASQVNAPCIIIDPHAAPSDWVGFNVVGSGRNYDAIATEFERLSQLMQTRYEARDKGQSQFDTVIVIIDEFPAIASALGKDATDTVKLLAREARKVQIRMCLLSQGAEVKTLGIDGEGSIRECFAMLRLGNFALTHAKSLKDKSISDALGNCDRPAMLDQTPCNLPVLSDRQSLPVLPLPRDYQALMADGATAPIFDTMDRPNQQQSASTALSSSTSALSTQNQVSAPLRAIIDYAKRKNDYVSARQIQSGIAMFKTTKADEIRHYFQWLADHGYGSVRGGADTLEFSANP